VEIKGVRHQRSYSLSSAPGDGLPAITIKRQPGGLVSNFLHDHIELGAVLTLGAPTGDFRVPSPAPARLLLIGAGSGITPLMSILRDLRRKQAQTPLEVVLLQICRDEDDAIFAKALSELASNWPALRIVRHYTADAGRLNGARFAALMPDFGDYNTLLCGPAGLMSELQSLWQEHGISERLTIERFGPIVTAATGDDTQARDILCAKSERSFESHGQPLLIEAEQAGLSPKYGCRIGICRSCQCRKRSGVTQNLLTGEINDEPDQLIQLCISAARSDLQLDL
jgi:ferredoxin-NADP reductase